MAEKLNLDWNTIDVRARSAAHSIVNEFQRAHLTLHAYPIPNGGIPAALAIQSVMNQLVIRSPFSLTEDPRKADFYIDDLIDSGATRDKHFVMYGHKPFCVLVNKPAEGLKDKWIVFPWERMTNQTGPTDAVTRLLQYIGDDPTRDGLQETPQRVIASYAELFSGYKTDPSSIIKTFEGDCDEMVVCRDIEFYSTCEHHMLPFFGRAHIAYVPNGKLIGLSKLARLLEVFSRRLQIQERLCRQVTKALDEILQPLGSACVLEAKHLCMCARGVTKQSSDMVTSSLTGVFRQEGNGARAEFLKFIGH